VAAAATGTMVGQAVGAGVGEAMDGLLGNPVAEKIVTGTLAGMASGATVTAMRGGRVNAAQIAADAFGNALGSSIVDGMRQTDAEEQRRAAQQEIADRGVDYFKDKMTAAGATQQQVDDFANSSEAQRLVDTARTLSAAQNEYGKPFDQLTPDQQAQTLKSLYRPIFGASEASADVSPVAEIDVGGEVSRVEITGKRYEPTLVESAASVLDTGAQAVNRLVEAVGGQERAAVLVTTIQAAIEGVPKTVLSLAVGEVTEKPIAYLSEKVSGLLQSKVFDGTGDADSVRTVSDTLGSFTVNSVLGTGASVVQAAGFYGVMKKATGLGRIYEQQVRDLYPGANLEPREYLAKQPSGSYRQRVADAQVGIIDGKNTVVEAKFTKDWDKSIYNPNGSISDKDFAMRTQADMLSQAQDYSKNFDQAIYHTNSTELMAHYNALFAQHGLANIRFELTDFKR
jgi:hypothetical protein